MLGRVLSIAWGTSASALKGERGGTVALQDQRFAEGPTPTPQLRTSSLATSSLDLIPSTQTISLECTDADERQ